MEPGKGYGLLARRSIAKPDELAYYVCFGPAGTMLEEAAQMDCRIVPTADDQHLDSRLPTATAT